MRFKVFSLSAVMAMGFATLGCFPEEDSCNIKTAGIYVQYEAVEDGSGTASVQANFWTGDSPGGTYLVLGDSCDDGISVNGVTLTETGTNPKYYHASVDVAEAYDFVFNRADEGDYTSTVTDLPPQVVILGPDGDSFSRAESFDITWEADAGDIELMVSGSCIWDYPDTLGDDVSDNGLHTVPANGIEATADDGSGNCTADIEMTRTVSGDLDANLKGTIYGKTRDSSSFTTTP